MKTRYYICRFRCWHLRGVKCVCGIKAGYWAERKCH